ncbi:hypothetical protein AVEN_23715-1 [Araneus ventricosus]|uniref:Uncharacterized protein n=1 Tax=Araneus ventricosus TaxID=182803 RepID=A0A4Y2J476_ARAVE|nr:hypothetical protein AVEN_23715-1 [Araneus ventricosus]
MSISPRELVTIKHLKDVILKKFSFERSDLLLFLHDGLLPEDENISNILRENDSVRLFYAEPSNVNLNDSRTLNYEGVEESSNDDQVKSPKKRKEHSDILEDNNEQIESNKKRKHSFSNGTFLFKNNSTPENSALISAVSDDIENVTSADLYNFENGKHRKSCKIKKKLKYSHDVSQNSLVSENEIGLTSDIIPMSEKNQNKINSCKKKKKHKHSKDVSENEIIFHDNIVRVSEINENKPRFHKKKKHKHSRDASKMVSVSESAVSFHDETIGTAEKLNDSVYDLETRNELSELRESIFQTVIDDSEVLKLAPVSFCASSVSTSSGIGNSLKTSQEGNRKISSEQNCSKSYVSDIKPVLKEENNLSVDQGNNCKKKKRKRRRKRKLLLISPQVDVSNDCNLEMTSPQQNENSDSLFMSASHQTPEISPRNKETSDNSKSDAFYSKRKANCSQTKSSFMEPFGSYLPSTSTPFLQTHAVSSASPRKNVMSKMPGSCNASEDQSCSVITSLNTILPAIQKKMVENNLSARSSPYSVTKNKNIATVPNQNFHEKTLSTKINNSNKCTDSFSDIEIKSRFLDPSFSYKGCPPLNSCPLVGTRIAYKILELDASYSPVVSNYKEGIVKAVNSQTDELEIELIEPEVKEGRNGKFENLYKDELPSCEVIRKVTLSWPSLIDPVRVIY